MPIPNPQSLIPPLPLPRWLKRNVPKGNANHFTAKLIGRLGLETVCDHAKCPNRMECYSQKTATFLILGDICTRGCRFCSVKKGKPQPPDPDEPRRVAQAAKELGLEHVVITCVTRDDLPDGGAEHFVQTIAEIRRGKKGDCPNFRGHRGHRRERWSAVVDENGTVPFNVTMRLFSPPRPSRCCPPISPATRRPSIA